MSDACLIVPNIISLD